MKKYDNLIFDFDGVICDSVNIKTDAFVKIYENENQTIKEKIKKYHYDNGGLSRFDKIRYYEKNLLKKEIKENIIQKKCDEFSKYVVDLIIHSKYIDGAYDFINHFKNKRQFVCTGTPKEEIDIILKKRGIDHLFIESYGSPNNKIENIKLIKSKYNIDFKKTVFFGDSLSDLNAAKYFSIDFIGIKNKITKFPKNTFQVTNFQSII